MAQSIISHLPKKERTFYFPRDRRLTFVMKPAAWVVLAILLLGPVAIAWIQFLMFGQPVDPSTQFPPLTPSDPRGFPTWLRVTHWVNFLFLTLIIRSRLSIAVDHPRLYFNDGC